MNRCAAPALLQNQDPCLETCATICNELGEKGWAVVDNFLPFEWVSELLQEQQLQSRRGEFRSAGTGRNEGIQFDPDMRGDRILWLDNGSAMPAQRQYLEVLEQLRQAVNQHLFLGLYELEVHAAIYSPGSFYLRHLDGFRAGNLRTLTTILYLNPRWHSENGGALRFYLDTQTEGEYFDVLPESGRLVTFLSERYYHEVLPTYRERSSITGWFSRRPLQ